MSVLLRVSRSATAGVDGSASLQLGPVPPWDTWTVERVTVSATTGDPVARLYRDTIAAATMLGGTWSGKLDTYDFSSPTELGPGQSLMVEFIYAAIGSTCSATASGTRT